MDDCINFTLGRNGHFGSETFDTLSGSLSQIDRKQIWWIFSLSNDKNN